MLDIIDLTELETSCVDACRLGRPFHQPCLALPALHASTEFASSQNALGTTKRGETPPKGHESVKSVSSGNDHLLSGGL